MLEVIRPHKAATRTRHQLPIPQLAADEEAWVVSFDGSAKPKRGGGSCGAILWKAPEWSVVAAETQFFEGSTVNEAEYRGAIAALELASQYGIERLIMCGDSRIVIQQLRGDIECRTPGLQVLRETALLKLSRFRGAHLVHVTRDYNASADLIMGKALQRQAGGEVGQGEYPDMELLNHLPLALAASAETADNRPASIQVVTRSGRMTDGERPDTAIPPPTTITPVWYSGSSEFEHSDC